MEFIDEENESIADLYESISQKTLKIRKLCFKEYSNTIKQMEETKDIKERIELFENFIDTTFVFDISLGIREVDRGEVLDESSKPYYAYFEDEDKHSIISVNFEDMTVDETRLSMGYDIFVNGVLCKKT